MPHLRLTYENIRARVKKLRFRMGSQVRLLSTASYRAEPWAKGMDSRVMHVPTLKPLDVDAILEHAAKVPVIVTIEEHTLIGGLGSAVAEVMAEASFDPAKRFRRIGIPDVFPDEYGSQASLMERYSITAEHLVSVVRGLVEQRSVVGTIE